MLLEFLNEYYEAELETIHDEAGNMHLQGRSRRFERQLFVKIFKEKDKFYAEQHVNQVYCPEIYLDSVIYEDNYIVVLEDRVLEDVLPAEVDAKSVTSFGQKLAAFHEKVSGKVLVPSDERPLSERLATKVARFEKTPYQTDVTEVFTRLQKDLAAADIDYALLPKVVLHGDFSIRNLMHHADELVLIDFERASLGVAYEDLIKFFYNEVKEPKLRNNFLHGYRQIKELEIPNYSLQRCLLFLCALDILEFHLTHTKQKFGQMAEAMFQTIKNEDAILAL
ncbi:aminoglycoside phosphotransferase family protein [Ligilactobacillus faecis]|uniref:Aminoglycoside phosphotransferase family protein n=1 Tax=Ligilactobacillus faecis TaxID=762833 RepID=A0ABV4DS50_9LACO